MVVTNPSPGGGTSNALNFTVNNPLPVFICDISRANLLWDRRPPCLQPLATISFQHLQILFNGVAATTTFISSTQLSANLPASAIASGASVSVYVSSPSPGGGSSSSTSLQLASVASLTIFATPVIAADPTGAWLAVASAKDASNNPIAGLPFAISASQGTLSIDQGVTDANGLFSTNVTPIQNTSTQVVGLVADNWGTVREHKHHLHRIRCKWTISNS